MAAFIGQANTLVLGFSARCYADVLRVEPIRALGAIIPGISLHGAVFQAGERHGRSYGCRVNSYRQRD